MTDKEQITIDGVDVSKCKYFEDGECGCEYYLRYGYEITMYDRCEEYPNCDFKQLARKTQECEELQEKLDYSHNDNIRWSEAWLKMWRQRSCYRKALEEIEGLIQSTLDDFEEDDEEVQLSYCHNISLQILDIISKAKGEE